MQALGIRHRPVLGVLRADDDHADASPERHVQDGPGRGPERRGRPRAAGVWREEAEGDRLFDHADHHGRSHGRARVHDRREGRRSSEIHLVATSRLNGVYVINSFVSNH